MSSEARQRAEHLVTSLLSELDARKLTAEIDTPIDEALADSCIMGRSAPTYGDFLHAVGAFVDRVNRRLDRGDRSVSAPLTMDEAVFLLRSYEGTNSSGHAAAFYDSHRGGPTAMDVVLLRLGESCKARRRIERIARLETQYVKSADWETRCAMVDALLERFRGYLPDEITMSPTGRLAGDLFQLVQTVAT